MEVKAGMKTIAGAASIALLFVCTGVALSGQSRLETDHARQISEMRVVEGATDEPSCGGTWLKVWTLGKEIRKMTWAIETSQRYIDREFYFSRGKVQLVIETSYWKLNDSGDRLKEPKFEYRRRYWLHDRTAGPAGVQIRSDLQQHADYLIKFFNGNRGSFALAE